jgi:hypothetical protein
MTKTPPTRINDPISISELKAALRRLNRRTRVVQRGRTVTVYFLSPAAA